MDSLYRHILDATTSWWGKLSGCALIGMIALGLPGYREEWGRNAGVPWLLVGGAIGLVAGLLLILHDYGRRPAPDRGAHVPGERMTRWPRWAVPVLAVVLVIVGIVAHFVWTVAS